MITLKTMRELLKPYCLKAFPLYPNSVRIPRTAGYWRIRQAAQLRALSAVTVKHEERFVHILFYDQKSLDEYFKEIRHIFADGTYQTRPNIRQCIQLLNVLAVISDSVRNLNSY